MQITNINLEFSFIIHTFYSIYGIFRIATTKLNEKLHTKKYPISGLHLAFGMPEVASK